MENQMIYLGNKNKIYLMQILNISPPLPPQKKKPKPKPKHQ